MAYGIDAFSFLNRKFKVFILLIFGTILVVSWATVNRNRSVVANEARISQRVLEDMKENLQKYNIETFDEKLKPLELRITNLENKERKYPPVKYLSEKDRKRILVTGGAGFVGSHLVDALLMAGHEVTVVDNFFTGRKRNIEHWIGHENFELLNHDIVEPVLLEVDQIYHLASPASPPNYMYNPIKVWLREYMQGFYWLQHQRCTEEHPQREEYWGHVNPIGPRACYDEGKRVAETMCYAYAKQDHVEVRVARIFNTFGPRMHMNDGRVVSNFIMQALEGKPLTVYGSGKQTRSFQYISDLVNGLILLMNSDFSQPVNIGNPVEYTIMEFAEMISATVGGKTMISNVAKMEDDPQRRKPDISRARKYLGWEPKVPLLVGLNRTIAYFKKELDKSKKSKLIDL
ncbi:hypothetical protein pdam_00014828 [Pocillopora damicornis]|uniref:UDP-glucuronate decarboxylase n=1 Tax=Pocillopora damicornis TaxID=46731 RepID=A0A3M6UCT5_POCDA|nr:hypothetical protein pdam_00014828 [Pocillopora damicornis]